MGSEKASREERETEESTKKKESCGHDDGKLFGEGPSRAGGADKGERNSDWLLKRGNCAWRKSVPGGRRKTASKNEHGDIQKHSIFPPLAPLRKRKIKTKGGKKWSDGWKGSTWGGKGRSV